MSGAQGDLGGVETLALESRMSMVRVGGCGTTGMADRLGSGRVTWAWARARGWVKASMGVEKGFGLLW